MESTPIIQTHPGVHDCGLVVAVTDTTLTTDRGDKKTLSARYGIIEYWIVNLIEPQIEVDAQPSGPAEMPDYQLRKDYKRGDLVPLRLDGGEIGTISVDGVLP